MRATFRRGPVGTGAYLLGKRGSWSDPEDVEVWLLLLFVPLIPLSLWTVTASEDTGDRMNGEVLELTVLSRARVRPLAAVRRMARGATVGVVALLPLTFAIWQMGNPWASPLVTMLLGSILSAGVLGKVSMAIELGVPLLGAALPLLVLMHLDERVPRVPFLAAIGVRE